MKVLIAEDEITIRLAIVDQLKRIPQVTNIVQCRTTDEALPHLGTDLNVAILDLQLPSKGNSDPDAGFKLVEELQRVHPGIFVPIIILTIRNDQGALDRAKKFGGLVQYFISKPWLSQDLVRAVTGCIEMHDDESTRKTTPMVIGASEIWGSSNDTGG